MCGILTCSARRQQLCIVFSALPFAFFTASDQRIEFIGGKAADLLVLDTDETNKHGAALAIHASDMIEILRAEGEDILVHIFTTQISKYDRQLFDT